MGAASPISAGLGGIGSLVSANTGKNSAKAANAAAQQAAQNQGQVISAEQQALSPILSNYFGSGGTAATSNNLMGQLGQSYNSPTLGNSYASGASGTAGALQNFNGLQPAQLNELMNTNAQSGQSTISSLLSRLGGVANQGNLGASLLDQNLQNNENAAINLGSQAAGQQLGALETAGGLQSGLSSQVVQNSLGQLGALGTQTGQQTGLLQSGLGSLGQLANMFGQQGQQAAGNAQTASAAKNPFPGLASAAASPGASSLFGGSTQGSSPYSNSVTATNGSTGLPITNQASLMSYAQGGQGVGQGQNGGFGALSNPNQGGYNGPMSMNPASMGAPKMGYR